MYSTIPLITKQLRWKWADLAKYITIFMPIAMPADIALFDLLNSKAKKARVNCPLIYSKVASHRRKMSRIKLAEAGDIGQVCTTSPPLVNPRNSDTA